ncbi:hypothetical protein JK208_05340 [Gluconobacter sp. Dm-74]|uniref:hypothetical protein n=1 Tax=Gluconobacter sp. Dm-74 TaxID=2799803 RepID=UPI001B8CE757|nr:hypothetical protein [Gluconobacter sp. Dm-74]MBS1091029.1 hypothetical protein [Gluconobacter sp. Dm-74]
MSIATHRPTAVVIAPTFSPASGDLKALIEAKREGYLWRSDLTPDRIRAVCKQLSDAERACLQPNPVVVASWLKGLAQLVSNGPADPDEAATRTRAIFEVCSDIPAGVWTPATRVAWTRQPPRNGYPVGSRWPAPGELYTHLLPFAEAIRAEVAGLREILAMAEKPREPERKRPDAKELARAGALAAAVIRELRATSGETESRA